MQNIEEVAYEKKTRGLITPSDSNFHVIIDCSFMYTCEKMNEALVDISF